MQTLSQTPSSPPLAQLHAVPSGPVAVTQSRAQRCPPLPVRSCSRHERSPQLLCSALSTQKVFSFTIFVTSLWMFSHGFMFLHCATQTDPVLKVRLHSVEKNEAIPSPARLAGLGPMHCRVQLALVATTIIANSSCSVPLGVLIPHHEEAGGMGPLPLPGGLRHWSICLEKL